MRVQGYDGDEMRTAIAMDLYFFFRRPNDNRRHETLAANMMLGISIQLRKLYTFIRRNMVDTEVTTNSEQ
jgi:hypothetical protein